MVFSKDGLSLITILLQENMTEPKCFCKNLLKKLVTAKTLAQAFVGGRLDYCNSLLYGVSKDLLRRLQSVQNAAARFITGARKYDHISPVLRDLHWLPLRQRIIFKIATLMHQYLKLWNDLPKKISDCQSLATLKKCLVSQFKWNSLSHLYNSLDGYFATTRTRLRLGLSDLRGHLFSFNLTDNPICPLCLDQF